MFCRVMLFRFVVILIRDEDFTEQVDALKTDLNGAKLFLYHMAKDFILNLMSRSTSIFYSTHGNMYGN